MAGADGAVRQLRCPVCFVREVDVVLRRTADDAFACVKCSFTGAEADIRQRYDESRGKYRWRDRRLSLTDLDRL